MCSLRVAWSSPGSKTAPIAVLNYWYQLCGQAKAALQIQRHTCLCKAARITNTVVRRTTQGISHNQQPYKQFSTSSHLSASTTNFHKSDYSLATTFSAVLCDKCLSLSSTNSSVLDLCYLRWAHAKLVSAHIDSDSGKMGLDSCMRKFVNASGLAWVFDNCVPSLAVLCAHGKTFVAWVVM